MLPASRDHSLNLHSPTTENDRIALFSLGKWGCEGSTQPLPGVDVSADLNLDGAFIIGARKWWRTWQLATGHRRRSASPRPLSSSTHSFILYGSLGLLSELEFPEDTM